MQRASIKHAKCLFFQRYFLYCTYENIASMKISLKSLTVQQITIIKGIAISIIVLHNFIHLLTGIGENQMNFDPIRISNLLNMVTSNPTSALNLILSFFGHFGVQLFVFASGYGLVKKHQNNVNFSFKKFIIPKIIKIYSLLAVGLLFFFVIFANEMTAIKVAKTLISSLSLCNNFFSERIFLYGPWWYFSLAVQLYLLFPLIFRFINKNSNKNFYISLITSGLLIYALFPITEHFNIPIFGICIGHLPEFILGIGFARYAELIINSKIFLLALIIFVASNLSIYLFPLSFISATIILLTLLYPIYNDTICKNKNGQNIISKIFFFLGTISMFMFALNGHIRFVTIPFLLNITTRPYVVNENTSQLFITLSAFLHFGIIVIIAYFLSHIYKKAINPILNKITTKLLGNNVDF